jgi:hypothetical protein
MRKYRKSDKSELDAQRELLDSLMGINRNNDREQDEVKDYRDERCCKFYITGMCPNGNYFCFIIIGSIVNFLVRIHKIFL